MLEFFSHDNDLEKYVGSKLKILHDSGVSEMNAIRLLHFWPSLFVINLVKVKKIVKESKDMGFIPSKYIIALAVFTHRKEQMPMGKEGIR